MNTRRGASVLAAACLLALTACTGGQEQTDPEDEGAVDAAAAGCTTQPETQGGVTAPGEVLCLGTTATVPVFDGDGTGEAELTVTGVRQLPEEERVKFDQSAFYGTTYPSSEFDVHLVRYTVTVVSEEEPGAFTGPSPVFDVTFSSVEPWADEVVAPVGLGPSGCRSADHARGQAADEEVKGCEWAFVRKGQVHGARFRNATAGYHPEQGGDYVYWK